MPNKPIKLYTCIVSLSSLTVEEVVEFVKAIYVLRCVNRNVQSIDQFMMSLMCSLPNAQLPVYVTEGTCEITESQIKGESYMFTVLCYESDDLDLTDVWNFNDKLLIHVGGDKVFSLFMTPLGITSDAIGFKVHHILNIKGNAILVCDGVQNGYDAIPVVDALTDMGFIVNAYTVMSKKGEWINTDSGKVFPIKYMKNGFRGGSEFELHRVDISGAELRTALRRPIKPIGLINISK